MEHLTVYFKHGIRDIIPYSEFIQKTRKALSESGVGQYLGDDMAIDGGDAEATFSGHSANVLFGILRDDLGKLSFMNGAKVTLIFGELDSDAPREEILIGNFSEND